MCRSGRDPPQLMSDYPEMPSLRLSAPRSIIFGLAELQA